MKQLAKKVIRELLSKTKWQIISGETYIKLDKELKFKTQLIDLFIDVDNLKSNYRNTEVIIFSYNRPLQLHALLSSFYELVEDTGRVNILCKTTSEEYTKAYKEVLGAFNDKDINFVLETQETIFKDLLIKILEEVKSEKLFFLVDDIVFKERVSITDLLKYDFKNFIPSLRMGNHLSMCNVHDENAQPLPKFQKGVVEPDKLCWIWNDGVFDWGYPLSVDGHIFLTKEILLFSKMIEFKSPNTYEAHLNIYIQYFNHRYGVSYKTSKLFNMPINKVTSEAENFFGEISTEFLLTKWQDGFQMNYKKLYGFINYDTHQPIDIDFIKR